MSLDQLVGMLHDEMHAGDGLVAAAGTIPANLTNLFDTRDGKIVQVEFGNSCMGYDIRAAIGVRLAGTEVDVHVLRATAIAGCIRWSWQPRCRSAPTSLLF